MAWPLTLIADLIERTSWRRYWIWLNLDCYVTAKSMFNLRESVGEAARRN
jgi:hypothetical protein